MEQKKIKENIKLRQKLLSDGNISLYLDIYLSGKRQYEFLKLYLIPEKTKSDREKNRQTMQFANAIKSKRLIEVQNGEYGFITSYIGNSENIHPGNLITVSYNGSIGYSFYQPVPFVASDDINILYPLFNLNKFIITVR